MSNLTLNKKNFLKSKDFVLYYRDDLYIKSSKDFIDKVLNTIKLRFRVFEQIDINNLREFWLDILKAYQNKTITRIDVVDSLEDYINRRFESDYPEFEWLNFPDSDPRSIGYNTTQFVREAITFGNLAPEFITVLQNYLQTPHGKEQEANAFMKKYIEELKIKRQEKAIHHFDGSYTYTFDQLEENDKKI